MSRDLYTLRVDVPRKYNAAQHFVDRHLDAGHGERIAFVDNAGQHTYADFVNRVGRTSAALATLGVDREQRVLVCMLDTLEFAAVFWAAIRIGAVPVPVNTLLTGSDYDYMLRDSRAVALVVSDALYDRFTGCIEGQPFLKQVVVSGRHPSGGLELDTLIKSEAAAVPVAETCRDDAAFWLYTSGSTGTPKGVIHHQSDLIQTASLYGDQVLGIRPDDRVFSAAKLFFAYGLGNAMTFPLHVGAGAALLAERPTPDAVLTVLKSQESSIFFGVPTLFNAILANPDNDRSRVSDALRLCVSAGEALPSEVGKEWERRFGVPVLDGLGSTEMLHIFLSNRPGDIRYGTSGRAVPGYRLRIVDEDNHEVSIGEMGELLVSGPSAASSYWNQRDKTAHTFEGGWIRSGDKYVVDEDGYYHYFGRTDDMLKVGGIWVSPFEVESALLAESRVLEVAVVAQEDEAGLIKPKAYVVLKENIAVTVDLETELQAFVKTRLAPFKYPRWIEFVDDLPKTATGKIRRFKLREIAPAES